MALPGEVPLSGGNVTDGVVRIGDTVRRPLSPNHRLAHAVLRHLEDVGFPHSPRLLGLDGDGREILSFAPGATVWPSRSELLDDGGLLPAVGRLARSYHDAMATFPAAVDDDGAIVLHNDFAPWNLVVGEGGAAPWTLIDWDEVGPGEVAWELAYVLHTFVPLWYSTPFAEDAAEIRRRVDRFAQAYGAAPDLVREALTRVPARCRSIADETEARAARGIPGFVRMVADGHPESWRNGAEHVAERLPRWLDA